MKLSREGHEVSGRPDYLSELLNCLFNVVEINIMAFYFNFFP
jgi:hypothetical protein